MSGTSIGEVNINLRMSLAQFKQDARQGTDEATRASRQMADAFQGSSEEARGSLMLLGEEIGVHIPRHLTRVIANLPGVQEALTAAFSSVAVLAFLEVLSKIVEKILKTQESVDKANTAMQALNKSFEDDIRKLTTAHAAWVDLGNGIQEVSDKWYNAQKAQDNAKGGIFKDFLDVSGIGYAAEYWKKAFTDVSEASHGAADANKALLDGIAKIAKDEGPKAALLALNNNLHMLGENLKDSSPAIQDVAAKLQSQLTKELDAAKKKAEEAAAKMKELNNQLIEVEKGLAKLPTTRSASGLHLPNPSGDTDTGIFGGLGEVGKVPSQTPVNAGSKEAQELYKIQTDQNEAIKEAQKVYTQTRNATEQYNEQLAILDTLLKQGKIDQDTYTRAKQEAAAKNDVLTKSEMEFGRSLGESLKSALLLGSGFGNMAKSMIVDLAQLIIKITLFKSITDAISTKKGGGGFLGSLIGGFAGMFADGGTIGPGQWGIAGEAGPEFVTGGRGGATVVPMGRGGSGGNTYNIDARGAAPGTAEEIKRALREAEDRAVARSVTTMSDINRRR